MKPNLLAICLSFAVALADGETLRMATPQLPVALPQGLTDVDAHGDAHNGPVALGVGAKATSDVSGLATGTVVRAVSVAIGDGADATDPNNPAKQQAIAIGNQSRAAAVNSIAIGSGVRHEDETDLTGGNAYAAAPQAIALGYEAKSLANGAVQIGPGKNEEPNTLKFGSTTIVRNGQVVGGMTQEQAARVALNAVEVNAFAKLKTGTTTNGYVYARMDAWDADNDYSFQIYANTNRDAAAPLTIPSAYGNIEVYGTATIDRKLEALEARIAALEEALR